MEDSNSGSSSNLAAILALALLDLLKETEPERFYRLKDAYIKYRTELYRPRMEAADELIETALGVTDHPWRKQQ
jgi:hypothetical protein